MGITVGAGRMGQRADARARQGARLGALWGLAARGVLYLVLAALAADLVVGGSGSQVDARGALHDLAHDSFGRVVLVVLAIGFTGFALWHLALAFARNPGRAGSTHERIANGARVAAYGGLAALAVSFLTTSASSESSDQTDKTWTAKLLDLTGGRLIVGAVALVVIGGGLYLLWRMLSEDEQDEPAVAQASPRETPTLRVLARVGNAARGTVVVLVGAFLLNAAIEHDPKETVGLDGALRRLLDGGPGDVAVAAVAAGFAMFGIYSLARAWVNREGPLRESRR